MYVCVHKVLITSEKRASTKATFQVLFFLLKFLPFHLFFIMRNTHILIRATLDMNTFRKQ